MKLSEVGGPASTGDDAGPAAQIPFGPVPYSQLHLTDKSDTSGIRPFGAGEYLLNQDPSKGWSSEMSATVKMPDGSWSVVPGLWLDSGKPVHVDEDQAARYAADFETRSGNKFPRFAGEQQANQFSESRESAWQGKNPGDPVPPLYQTSAPKTMKLSQIPADPEIGTSPFIPAKPEGPSRLERFWHGLLRAPIAGAQLAAHAGVVTPEAGMPEFGVAGAPGEMEPLVKTADIDKAVNQWEQTYQGERRAAGQLGTDWYSLLGGVVGTAPLAVIPGAQEGILPAALGGAVAGAAGGALEPVTGRGSFAGQKLAQTGLGAATGGILGGAAGAVAPVARDVAAQFRSAIKPRGKGIATFTDTQTANDKIRSAVDAIVANKDKLNVGDNSGELPKTVEQFSQAIGQTKAAIFQRFDEMAQTAETAQPGPNTAVPKFQQAYAEAAKRVMDAQRTARGAERMVLMSAAKRSRVGEYVYTARKAIQERAAAESRATRAQAALDRAQSQKQAALQNLRGVWVDTDPAVGELNRIASSVAADTHPSVTQYASQMADRLSRRGAYSPSEAQDVIQRLNASLKAFYDKPTYENAARASINSMVANRLREGLGEAIEGAVGVGYQDLRRQYGALSLIEKDVTKQALALAKKDGSLFSDIGSLFSAEQVLHGLASFSPGRVATGIGMKAVQAAVRKLRDPNRQVRRMFSGAEQVPPSILRRGIGAGLDLAAPGAGGQIGRGIEP